MILEHTLGFLGLLGTLLGLFVTLFYFTVHRRSVLRLKQREDRLPDSTKFEDLRRRVVDYESRFESIQEQLLNAREEIGKGHAAKGEYEQLTSQCSVLRSELAELDRDSARRKYDMEAEHGKHASNLRSELNRLEEDAESRKRQIENEIKQHEAELESHRKQLDRDFQRHKETVNAEIEKQISATREQLLALQEEVSKQRELVEQERQAQLQSTKHKYEEHLFETRKKFEQQKLNLDIEREQILAQMDQLREELETKLKKDRELSERIDQLEGYHGDLERSVKTLQSEKAQLENTIPQLRQLWDRLLQQTGGGDDSERTSELWQPVLHRGEMAGPISEQECLVNIENYLETCGLHFSPRIVRAFHTSLKVANASPLVVLAGISGTGKSELPRRYAEAVGMNFLPLAVQPRWDSPQDMFGFFNYLENRFRATELGRALVQMDHFASELGRGWPSPIPESYESLSDQMLLVLLDEMNLARVEYYFSDFLSKLETRRGVDVHDAEQRNKAELSLEIGRTGIGSPVMNVFVGSNVLFVGTMNEDETTQTLSDKVVDRSNLIRFGCPKRLNIESNGRSTAHVSKRLAAGTWRDWLVPVEDMTDDRERTDDLIDRLNQAMSKIRRPFAHRTSQAIRAYVANYPRFDAASFNHAMADQIEQKLLPKFRGLDPSETEVRESLDKIRDIIEELEDLEFLEALQASRVGHQIAWSGVDRTISGQIV